MDIIQNWDTESIPSFFYFMHFDIRTVFFITALSALMLGISLFFTARSYENPPKGMKLWALACLGIGLGWQLSASREFIPEIFSIILGNTLSLLSFTTFYHAVKELKEESFNRKPFYLAVGGIVLLLIYFNYFSPDIRARSILVSGFGVFIGLLSAKNLLFNNEPKSFSHKMTAIIFLFCSMAGLYRIFYLVFINSSMESLFEQNSMQDVHIASVFIGIVISSFGFMLMTADKINLELSKANNEVKTLSALLPICSYCKSIRGEQNDWLSIESYITEHTDSRFSHTFCPDCYDTEVRPQLDRLRAGKNQ